MTIHTLSDLDLLALLVGKKTAKTLYAGSLTELLFAEEGSAHHVEDLAAARELMRRALAEDLQKRDVLSSPAQVVDYLRLILKGREHEVFVTLFLGAQHHLIAAEELFQGTLTQTSVYPREVVKRALALNAAAVIFAHNHPSGVPEPSRADEVLTSALKQALALVDVKVLDHFVVAGAAAVSFAERGLM
jgi:DNA repair protein RadC